LNTSIEQSETCWSAYGRLKNHRGERGEATVSVKGRNRERKRKDRALQGGSTGALSGDARTQNRQTGGLDLSKDLGGRETVDDEDATLQEDIETAGRPLEGLAILVDNEQTRNRG